MRRCILLLAVLLVSFVSPAAGQDAGRTKTRLLYSFEDGGEAARLMKSADKATLSASQDAGVTDGKNSARLVVPRGVDYGFFFLDADAIRNWGDFDYAAIDLTTEDEHPYTFHFELWDRRSTNYATRCTWENVTTRPGRQTLLYPINRARRNSKEGREWDELEPQDKIDLNSLTQVKIFVTPRKDRDAIFWIDNIRLLQEDAARPKMKVPLADGSIAFKLASAGVRLDGFKTVSPQTAYTAKAGAGFDDPRELTHGGEGWPDVLTGTFVTAPEATPFTFRARVPNGEYRVWLSAGPIYRAQPRKRWFLLKVNGKTVVDENPSVEAYYSEKFLYRFLKTQYSEKPHALWERYIDRMYPTHSLPVTVKDGTFTVEAIDHFLSAVVLVPAAAEKKFDEFTAAVRKLRIAAFERNLRPLTHKKPQPGSGAFHCYVPDPLTVIRPWTGPGAAEQKRTSLHAAGAPGQNVILRLAITPFEDLGTCTLDVSDLVGPETIPAKSVAVHFQNYRYDGDTFGEMALIPSRTLEIEKGVTQCFWLWLTLPADANAGVYRGKYTFQAGKREPVVVPVEMEVYPFKLEPVLPASFGMYYLPHRRAAGETDAELRRLLKEQFAWMRRVGFTAVPIGAPTVMGLAANSTVRLQFDDTLADLAKEVGFGRHPKQYLMGNTLGIGRAIGRRLPGSLGATVDRNPGIELRQPEFRGYFLNALGQYREWIEKKGLPVAVEVVDEPREVPNPWNRNLADTRAHVKLVREAGLVGFVTPMADTNSGKDYIVLADELDIVSIHAWKPSERLMERAQKNKKTLWLYNTGMDRFSWGFYNWRAGSEGRWEWHFCWSEDNTKGGYLGREWYNPFTGSHGFAPHAPASYPGGMLYQSAYLDVAEGITDYAYLITLEKAIAAQGKETPEVREARQFLEALKRAIPAIPGTKGLATEADGALVGLGVQDEATLLAPKWRDTLAGHLKKLQR